MQEKHVQHIKERVRQSYAVIADEFDATRQKPWEEFRHFLAYVREGARVLDAGCGNGRLFEILKGEDVQYLGVDNNLSLLEAAKQHFPQARFELGDMTAFDLPEGTFDNIFCVAAFHHVPGKRERRQVVHHFYRALKHDGVLVLTVWNLFQWKYAGAWLRAIGAWLLHLGLRYAWNDLWIRWGHCPLKRYYHAFMAGELRRLFPSDQWKIEEFYFTRKGNRVSFWRSFNLILIARKKN
ncbi:MAG: methyltransferase domain-containing protein [Candidatus Peregrinibacteria bacterium]